ncbi:hypothetical protein M5F74_17895 [Salmonella enterica]|nr:hypothetical protein [Salmonella enterica]MCN0064307.1 hypothetical protein [Salmonella enterica]
MIWQPEFTDKTLSRKIGAVQTPGGVAASINGKDYYLFTGEYGKKGFPEKTLKAK